MHQSRSSNDENPSTFNSCVLYIDNVLVAGARGIIEIKSCIEDAGLLKGVSLVMIQIYDLNWITVCEV